MILMPHCAPMTPVGWQMLKPISGLPFLVILDLRDLLVLLVSFNVRGLLVLDIAGEHKTRNKLFL